MANEELLELIIKDFSKGMITNIDSSDKMVIHSKRLRMPA